MNDKPSHLVFLSEEAVAFLKPIKLIKIQPFENLNYIVCSNLQESPHFVDLIISHEIPTNSTGHDFVISLHYHHILFSFAVQEPDLKKIFGFRNEFKDEDNQS